MRKWATSLALIVGLLAAGRAAAQQPSFRTSIGDQVLGNARSLVVDDLDGDGKSDLILAVRGDGGVGGAVSIFYGLGDGFFEAQIDPTSGNVPTSVAVGDFNGDERKDVVSVDPTSVNPSVILALENRGEFSEPLFSNPRTCSVDLTLCELDENCPEGQTCELRNGTSPAEVQAADLNGDSKLDLAIASDEMSGQVAVLFGVGDGTFVGSAQSPYDTGTATQSLVIVDINKDTRPDIVAANRDSGTISVLVNNGNGTFLPPASFPGGESPVDIAAGDLDEDGNVDVITANRNTDSFSVLRGNGNGTFAPPVAFPAGTFPTGVATGDFDLDDNLDVVVSNSLSYDATISFGTGTGSFSLARSFLAGTGPIDVAVGPIDADNRPDVVVLSFIEAAFYHLLLAEEGRSFLGAETFRTTSNPSVMAIGDITADGRPDAIIASSTEMSATLLEGTAGETLRRSLLDLGKTATAILLADLDRDGHAELLITSSTEVSGQLGLARPQGKSFAPLTFTTVGRSPSGLDAADFNEDGLVDVVVSEGGEDAVAILLSQPNGSLGAPTRILLRPLGDPDPFQPQAVAAGDLDLDGNVDLAVVNFRDAGILSILYGRGNGTFENPVTQDGGRRPLAVEISDVDNDGRPDILSANADRNGLIIHRANGARTYDANRALSLAGQPEGFTLRDVTADGIRDLIVADFTDERDVIRPAISTVPPAAPYFRATVQLCPQPNCLEPGRSPRNVRGADFNGDGPYDLLTLNDEVSAKNVSLALSDLELNLLRGDGNHDGRVSAADLVSVLDLLPRFNRMAIEDLRRSGRLCGSTTAAPCDLATMALDADGDGLFSTVDTTGVAARIFR